MITLVLICVVIVLTGWAAFNKIRRPPNYPPGKISFWYYLRILVPYGNNWLVIDGSYISFKTGPPGFFSFFQLKKDNEPFISHAIAK